MERERSAINPISDISGNPVMERNELRSKIIISPREILRIPAEFQSQELWDIAVRFDSDLIRDAPLCFQTPDLWGHVIFDNVDWVKFIPTELQTQKFWVKMWESVVEIFSNRIRYNRRCSRDYIMINPPRINDYYQIITSTFPSTELNSLMLLVEKIPAKFHSENLWKHLIACSANFILSVPSQLQTENLWGIAIGEMPQLIKSLPSKFQTRDHYCRFLQINPSSLPYIPQRFIDIEFYEIAIAYGDIYWSLTTVLPKIPAAVQLDGTHLIYNCDTMQIYRH